MEKTILAKFKCKNKDGGANNDIMNILAQDQDLEITKSGEKVLKVKSFSTVNQTLPICEYVMPLSHFCRINPDYDQNDPDSSRFSEGGKNLWILKPVGMNRGQGIHVVNSIKKCKKLIKEYCFGREVENI